MNNTYEEEHEGGKPSKNKKSEGAQVNIDAIKEEPEDH